MSFHYTPINSKSDLECIIDLFDNTFNRLAHFETKRDIRHYEYKFTSIVIEKTFCGTKYYMYFGLNLYPDSLTFSEFFERLEPKIKKKLLFNLDLFTQS